MYDLEWIKRVTKRHDLEISNDSKRVDMILDGLNKTGGYCPCVPRYGWSTDVICPCSTMRNEGKCKCGIFNNK
jgi:ferredoxin-thioredoxin reductase catalytic subunit